MELGVFPSKKIKIKQNGKIKRRANVNGGDPRNK